MEKYSDDAITVMGTPRRTGRRDMLDTRVFDSFVFSPFLERAGVLSSPFRTPSRERNRMVERRSSNWIVAVPKTSGETSRTSDWLRAKVTRRETSWRRTREEADANELARRLPCALDIMRGWR